MRLICPNCDAQYEVDDQVIPDGGRDVQCSNCGHTWFQMPAHLDTETPEEFGFASHDDASEPLPSGTPLSAEEELAAAQAEIEAPSVSEPIEDAAQPPEPEVTEPVQAPPAVETWDDAPAVEPDFSPEAEDASLHEAIADAQIQDVEDNPPAPPERPQTVVSEDIKDLLREEAAYNDAFSDRPTDGLDSQPDLGIDEAQASSDQAMREKMARLRGLDPADPALTSAGVAANGKRRELLPDIEEINSTLSADDEREADGTVLGEEDRRVRAKRGGFKSVFALLVIAAALLVGLYVLAPSIAESVPALAGPMETYVNAANDVRADLDVMLKSVGERLNSLLSQLNSDS